MADRYTYIPLVGIFIMVAWSVVDLATRVPATRPIVVAAAALAVAACTVASVVQVGLWRDSVTLLTHALAVTRDNEDVHFGLGLALAAQGRVEEAIPHWREAVRLYPDYAAAHLELARALARTARSEEAITHYEAALRHQPSAAAHDEVGAELAGLGRTDEAIAHLRIAVRLAPGVASSHYNLGLALALGGKADEAAAEFEDALRREPTFAPAHYQLGLLRAAAGRTTDAVAAYRAALRLRPGWPDVENDLAWLLATAPPPTRDPVEAMLLAEHASEATGHQDPVFLDTLAIAYAAAGRFGDAIKNAERALALAREAGDEERAAEVAKHLDAFRAGRPVDAGSP
jgi:tetratricopeptide (TPR) repeat protein